MTFVVNPILREAFHFVPLVILVFQAISGSQVAGGQAKLNGEGYCYDVLSIMFVRVLSVMMYSVSADATVRYMTNVFHLCPLFGKKYIVIFQCIFFLYTGIVLPRGRKWVVCCASANILYPYCLFTHRKVKYTRTFQICILMFPFFNINVTYHCCMMRCVTANTAYTGKVQVKIL